MKIARFLSFSVVAAGLAAPIFAMTNADIIKMKQAEFSDDTILMTIAKEPANFDTSPDGLVELKKAGVSETIIQRLFNQGGNVSALPAPSVQELPPAPLPKTEEPVPAPAPQRPNYFGQEFPSISPPFVNPVAGQDYYTRSTLHFEDGEYAGTNYARGSVVPINTKVRIDAIRSNAITLHRADTGDKLEVKNVEKYTRKSTVDLARLLFSAEPTPLDRLPPDLAGSIRQGEMRKGMTKEQVLLARGYPPAHETPSSDADRWVYWSSRFVKQTVVFANGRLVEARGVD